MKKCNYCGLENSDAATQCVTCQTDLTEPAAIPSRPQPRPVTPLEEQRFWERMTFRQFAALFLRLQAIWLLFYAALDLTYFPGYIGRSFEGGFYITGVRLNFFLMVLRIILHVAAAVAIIQYADRLLSWLVRDWIRNQPPINTTQKPAAAPSVSNVPGSPKSGDQPTPNAGDSSVSDR